MNLYVHANPAMRPPDICPEGYAALRLHAGACALNRTDRVALAELLVHVHRVGIGAYPMMTALLSQKLVYASLLAGVRVADAIAASGSRCTFSIDDLEPQSATIFLCGESSEGQNGLSVRTLLVATLIGMKVGTFGPLLQSEGTLRRVHLLSVRRQTPTP